MSGLPDGRAAPSRSTLVSDPTNTSHSEGHLMLVEWEEREPRWRETAIAIASIAINVGAIFLAIYALL